MEAEAPQGAAGNAPAQYHVIEDDAELTAADVRDPAQDFDPQTQEPIVTIDFTERGRRAFERVTRRIAARGRRASPQPGQPLEERFRRFAIVLDDRVVSTPTIDFVANPEGIDGSTGAQLAGLGSVEDTKAVADSLRLGPLPARLERVR